jgi:hypothetical protein
MKAACQEEWEYALWAAANRAVSNPSASPCHDCLAPFASEMAAEGRCVPDVRSGRPRTGNASEERRSYWRDKSRAYRQRMRAA